MPTEIKVDPKLDDGDIEKWAHLLGQHFVRWDPKTKQPHASGKDSFYEIIHMYHAVKAGGDMNKPVMEFMAQRFHRGQTYDSAVLDDGGTKRGSTKRHVAWSEYDANGNMVSPGFLRIPGPDFIVQFGYDS